MSESLAAQPNVQVRRLGRYEVLVDLGDDGFVSVAAARVRGPNAGPRLVELAKVDNALAREAEIKAAFLAEARAAGRIRHDHFVPPTDTLVHEGDLFVATEFVHGIRLEDLIVATREKSLDVPPMIWVRIILDVLAGLSAVHGTCATGMGPRPLVHGDVCPSTVIVSYRGTARLVHSGLSSCRGLCGTKDRKNRRLPYKAPEQLRTGLNAVAVDLGADLFAVGVMMWEMLSGRSLFEADAETEVIENILHGEIPALASVARDGVSARLATLVDLALQRDRDVRTWSALDFAMAIEDAVGAQLASIEDVAMLVDRAVGPMMDARREAIEARIAQVDSQPPSGPEARVESQIRRLAGTASLAASAGATGFAEREALGAIAADQGSDAPAFRLPDAADLMRPTEPVPASLSAQTLSSYPAGIHLPKTPTLSRRAPAVTRSSPGVSRTPSVHMSRTPSSPATRTPSAHMPRTPSVHASRTPSIHASRTPSMPVGRIGAPTVSSRPSPSPSGAPAAAERGFGLYLTIGAVLGAFLVVLFLRMPRSGQEQEPVAASVEPAVPIATPPALPAPPLTELAGSTEKIASPPPSRSVLPARVALPEGPRELAPAPAGVPQITRAPDREAPPKAVRRPAGPARSADGLIPSGI
jgi:serine/threonine-protein kinase